MEIDCIAIGTTPPPRSRAATMIETRAAVKTRMRCRNGSLVIFDQGHLAHVQRTAGLLHFDAGGRRGRAIKVALGADDL
ncbi:MAG TPA: hypothetical protein VFJ46_04210, partial [Xanthobacteraceae bacterium]|nr:hypothetical protein [Xanthobacteraceae bacterium]